MDIAGFPASSSKEDVSKLFPYGSKIFLHDGQYWILLEHFEGATLKPESKLKVIAPGSWRTRTNASIVWLSSPLKGTSSLWRP
ncbi:hypothetical protein WJX75_004477 [Coccomyxa subellipsoidea]|uniref:Uncharacterized protein n=1 Tax=Coccomyxa subellipsoidea TaxID=248742 RepID=A0ABR2YSL0_9CHLO